MVVAVGSVADLHKHKAMLISHWHMQPEASDSRRWHDTKAAYACWQTMSW